MLNVRYYCKMEKVENKNTIGKKNSKTQKIKKNHISQYRKND